MEVYIELVYLTNLFVNSFVVALALIVSRCRVRFWRVLLASSIGAIFGTIYPWLEFKGLWIVKILLAVVMVAICGKYSDFTHFLTTFFIFLAVTFLLGGIAVGGANILGIELGQWTLLAVSIAIFVCLICTRLVWKSFVLCRRKKTLECKIMLQVGDKNIVTTGFWDSGNKLYYKGYRPVMLIDENVQKLLYCDEYQHKMPSIAVKTVTGIMQIQVREVDKMTLLDSGKCYKNVVVGTSLQPLGEYGIILHSEL